MLRHIIFLLRDAVAQRDTRVNHVDVRMKLVNVSSTKNIYFREGGYVIVVVCCLSVSLSVC